MMNGMPMLGLEYLGNYAILQPYRINKTFNGIFGNIPFLKDWFKPEKDCS
jgi:hypothetical protein